MSEITPRGVKIFSVEESLERKLFIEGVARRLEAMGYSYVEVPSLVKKEMFSKCTEGTENRIFEFADPDMTLMPEVTNYIRTAGSLRLGSNKIYYIAKCFRDESTTDSERFREFIQIGVELLGDNALDCRKVVRKDALMLFKALFKNSPEGLWALEDNVPRGLNLYDASGKTFEIISPETRKQMLGGGPYDGGAGWALGVERVMLALNK